jgi:hypothetical protein
MLIINRAQCCLWRRQTDECVAILDAEDWSASDLDFQVAVAVLRNEFKEAARLVTKIGADGVVKKEAYEEWPLFKDFRQSDEFRNSYKQVFGQDFVNVAEVPGHPKKAELAAILESVNQILKEPPVNTGDPAKAVDEKY